MRALANLLPCVALAACSQPRPVLICHNANCAEPIDPASDDTLPALTRSLTLIGDDGRPVIDGIELDSFYRGADSMCLYAHDPIDTTESTPATAPADLVAQHFADPGELTHDGSTFHVLLELKAFVGPTELDRHTPEQRIAHAECTWAIYTILANAAVANNRDIAFEIESFSPELLRAVLDTAPAATPIPYTLGAVQGIPAPLDTESRPLKDYTGLPIRFVEFHDQWIRDAQYEATLSMHADIHLFMFSATTETFAAINQYEPASITTSEARLLRRWIDR